MSTDSILKREGINVLNELNTMEINKIASNISEKLTKAFPEHNLNKSDLFIAICRLNMYLAEMPNDNSLAKYFYKNSSIYFSKDTDFNNVNTLALHECIHYIQEIKDKHGRLLKFGLYNLETIPSTGMALNEAAVQLMASIANNSDFDTVRYYNLNITTQSPDYYPIQTALLSELIYFTGTYPVFHSTLYSNDVFKNTLIERTSAKTYGIIEKNFDLILDYENKLSKEFYKLSISPETDASLKKIRKTNEKIDKYKNMILEKTLETQNLIIESCFNYELDKINTLKDINNFKEKINDFRDFLITTENYTFFDDYVVDALLKLEVKKENIINFGSISALDSLTNELITISDTNYGLDFFKMLFKKFKLLLEEKIRAKDF